MNNKKLSEIFFVILCNIITLTTLFLGIYFLVEVGNKCRNSHECTIMLNDTNCVVKYDDTSCICNSSDIIIDKNYIMDDKNSTVLEDRCYTDKTNDLTQCPKLPKECEKVNEMRSAGIACTLTGSLLSLLSLPLLIVVLAR